VIEWLKEELAQHRRPAPAPAPELFAPASAALPAAPAAKRKAAAAAAEGGGAVKAEADANDKRSWMSSAQLWSCGGGHDGSTTTTSTTNGSAAAASKPVNKVGERSREKNMNFPRNMIFAYLLAKFELEGKFEAVHAFCSWKKENRHFEQQICFNPDCKFVWRTCSTASRKMKEFLC
jgi:hypothetical protein